MDPELEVSPLNVAPLADSVKAVIESGRDEFGAGENCILKSDAKIAIVMILEKVMNLI
jgi:hypothetical protein